MQVPALIPPDTTEEAWRAQIQSWVAMGPERRLQRMAELSQAVRETQREGIRSRHPEWSAAEVERDLWVLLYGEELALAAWARRTGR